MTDEETRIAEGLELLLAAVEERVRCSVQGVARKCQNGAGYTYEGHGLCNAASRAANDLLAVIAEYRATDQQLRRLRTPVAAPTTSTERDNG
jgi:hypothetical protein